MTKKKVNMTKKMVVTALRLFADAKSGRTYRPGDVVEGWGAVRAQHYAGQGLVSVEMVEEDEDSSKPDGQMVLPGPKEIKENDGKPGPKERKI